MTPNPLRRGIEDLSAQLDSASTPAVLDELAPRVAQRVADLMCTGRRSQSEYLIYLHECARRRANPSVARVQTDDEPRARVIPAEWIDALQRVLELNNTRLRLATVRCQYNKHPVTRIYRTSAGPVVVFKAYEVYGDVDRHDSATWIGDPSVSGHGSWEYPTIQRARHPPGLRGIVLADEHDDRAAFGAECQCSRQWLTIRHMRVAIDLAEQSAKKNISLKLLHDAAWRDQSNLPLTAPYLDW